MSSKTEEAKYAFRPGARYSISAQTVGKEMSRIQRDNGVTTPDAVVDAARPKSAPLHPVFEWRDAVAAESYRKWQARALIKSVTVICHENGNEVQKPLYVHIPGSAPQENKDGSPIEQPMQRGYQPLSVVVQRPDMYALALAELSRKFTSARDSMESLRRAAETSPETDQDRMTRIAVASQAVQTANAAVLALH